MESTWGESTRAYEASKKTLPWKKEDFVSVHSLSLRERRDKERELDPILMQYRNSDQEQTFLQTSKSSQKIPRQKPAYDIITHEGARPATINVSGSRKPQREYNLISHFPAEIQANAPSQYNEDFNRELQKIRASTTISSSKPRYTRDFSIISNSYYENNEIKQENEREKLTNELRERYWKTHTFDPVIGEFYDDNMEKIFRQEREQNVLSKSKLKESKLPSSTLNSEGKSYNIITTLVSDEERFKSSRSTLEAQRNSNRYKAKPLIEQHHRDRGFETADKMLQQTLNGVSFSRWQTAIDRGYDPVLSMNVSNLKPVPKRPPTLWDRLHESPSPAVQESVPKLDTSITRQPRDLSSTHGADPDSPTKLPQTSRNNLSLSKGDLSDGNNQRPSRTNTSIVPPLKLSQSGIPVKYEERIDGPPGLPIQMVRTGGLSLLKNL